MDLLTFVALMVVGVAVAVLTHPRAPPGRVVWRSPGRPDPEMLQVEVLTTGVIVTIPHQEPARLMTADALRDHLAHVRSLAPAAVSAHVTADRFADATEVLALLRAAGFHDLRLASPELARHDVAARRRGAR